jgi:hypothetical protein
MTNNIVFNAVDGYAGGGQMPAGYIYPLPIGFNSVVTLTGKWWPVPLYVPTGAQRFWYYILGSNIVVSSQELHILIYQ